LNQYEHFLPLSIKVYINFNFINNIQYFITYTFSTSLYHKQYHSLVHDKQPDIHNTPEFMWKPKWEKTKECFFIYFKNTFIGITNFQVLQNQLEGGTNPLIYRNQPKGNYNSLNSFEPTGMRL
jgi:hypothetical protein